MAAGRRRVKNTDGSLTVLHSLTSRKVGNYNKPRYVIIYWGQNKEPDVSPVWHFSSKVSLSNASYWQSRTFVLVTVFHIPLSVGHTYFDLQDLLVYRIYFNASSELQLCKNWPLVVAKIQPNIKNHSYVANYSMIKLWKQVYHKVHLIALIAVVEFSIISRNFHQQMKFTLL